MTKQDMMKEFSNWSDALRLVEGFNFDDVAEVVAADEAIERGIHGDVFDVRLVAQFRLLNGSLINFEAECDERGFVAGEEGWWVNVWT